jgi:hypothetical protein
MNEQNEAGLTPPPILSSNPPPVFPAPKPFSYWVRRFLACNPFYLVSAAMLLFGVYRISVDPAFLTRETAQLIFNFSALQVYEILLVLTAAFLAARRIWYDSTLLVGLENLLLFVPFILISQAALIDQHAIWVWCAACGLIAILRAGFLKRFVAQLNLPNRSLAIGLAFLVVNIALPVIYRVLHETRLGAKPDSGAAFDMNVYAWLLILPAALALGNFLPDARDAGNHWGQRRWLPAGLFALWALATGVHLYCLGYIYDFDLRREWLAPALWVCSWTAYRRLGEICNFSVAKLRKVLIVPPVLFALLAVSPCNKVFAVLAGLNVLIYGAIYFANRAEKLIHHLLFASVVMVIAGLPEQWVRGILPGFNRDNYVGAGIAFYFILCVALSRNPKLGLFGAITTGIAAGLVLGNTPLSFPIAVQCSLVFLLLHSLRWNDAEHQGATTLRVIAAILWTTYSIGWIHANGEPWITFAMGAFVLIVSGVARIFRGRWDQRLLPITATLVMLSGPGNALTVMLHATPSGLLAVIGSFVLFAAGTIAALTKHLWHHHGTKAE